MKVCSKCKVEKDLDQYYRGKRYKDGYRSACKPCELKRGAKWRESNSDHHRSLKQAWYSKTANKARTAETVKLWKGANSARVLSYEGHRRARKLQQCPTWANTDALQDVYTSAKLLGQLTGKTFHVDHIVPLNHALVSGLHTADNLQILTARQNLVKSNKFKFEEKNNDRTTTN